MPLSFLLRTKLVRLWWKVEPIVNKDSDKNKDESNCAGAGGECKVPETKEEQFAQDYYLGNNPNAFDSNNPTNTAHPNGAVNLGEKDEDNRNGGGGSGGTSSSEGTTSFRRYRSDGTSYVVTQKKNDE